MGLFGKKDTCCICNTNEGKYTISDGMVCKECFSKCGVFLKADFNLKNKQKLDVTTAIEKCEENTILQQSFVATKKIICYFEVDEVKKLWLIPDGFVGGKKNPIIYKFSDVVEFELIEDGNSITKGGIGRAVAGGLLFGGVGAIVGGVTGKRKTKSTVNKLQVKITVNSISEPIRYINLIVSEVKKTSLTYKTALTNAQEIISLLAVMTKSPIEKEENVIESKSVTDEIKEYKALMDEGIITQEEFESKKRKLLGI